MTDAPSMDDYSFNIIMRRGDPDRATTLSGHEVQKQNWVYFRGHDDEYETVKCADYHNEHFVYIDPVYNEIDPRKQDYHGWFAMCTCGSPAVLVGKGIGRLGAGPFDPNEKMLVCMKHTQTLIDTGTGRHQGQDSRLWM